MSPGPHFPIPCTPRGNLPTPTGAEDEHSSTSRTMAEEARHLFSTRLFESAQTPKVAGKWLISHHNLYLTTNDHISTTSLALVSRITAIFADIIPVNVYSCVDVIVHSAAWPCTGHMICKGARSERDSSGIAGAGIAALRGVGVKQRLRGDISDSNVLLRPRYYLMLQRGGFKTNF